MLLSLAMFLLLIACFLAMGALVFFCDGVIGVSFSGPRQDTPRAIGGRGRTGDA